ncbi:hypothetical protein GCM10010277_55200 [Streptomyces longisporoflavus]|uniref:hypothetical protein n=1 Tax=Streptomyces longisporoflavus TaxID=28044 RepID=UPI00167DF305|nr:hypothetical protein [Streptomyces longisporoflavus]GGV55281.1 hypothetical protein GCM10010277_55200 [Streptomyces longisporoflavus]
MNRKTIRIAGVTAIAALAIGVGGGVAQAHTEASAPRTAATAPVNQQQAIRDAARALLNSDIQYSAADRAELKSMADGRTGVQLRAGGKFGPLIKLLRKVPGFAKAVAGKYDDFKKWYNGLSWWIRGPLAAAGVGSDLWGIWQLFH